MIYNNEYKIKFYQNIDSSCCPVQGYINNLSEKDKAKVLKYIEFLREHKGILDEPYSKHIRGKVRELRVDLGFRRHRIFYFTFVGKNIILLHAFLKQTSKTPEREIDKAIEHYENVLKYQKIYK